MKKHPVRITAKKMRSVIGLAGMILLLVTGLSNCKKPESTVPKPGPVPGQAITDEQRMAVFEQCQAISATFKGQPNADQLLVSWLQAQPYFEEAGYAAATRNVWARFRDGRLLLFIDNREPAPFDQRGGRISREAANGLPDPPASGARTDELPAAKKAVLLNGMGSQYIDGTAAISLLFASAKAGYDVWKDRLTVDNLKKVDKQTAVLYLSTHGALGYLRDSLNGPTRDSTYALWTSEKATKLKDSLTYKTELTNGTLCYAQAYTDATGPNSATLEIHYCITPRFVTDSMQQFGRNSLLYVDACSSKSPQAAKMVQAFQGKAESGNSAYLGWSFPTGDKDAYRAAKFLFDRLLGANSNIPSGTPIPKEDPPQRPFDLAEVFNDMQTRTPPINQSPNKQDPSQTAILSFVSTIQPDNRFILAPSIASLDIDENTSELTINGIFGEDPRPNGARAVTVEGNPVTIKTWGKDKIVCTIPDKGAGAAGNVIVKVRDRESNRVPLTEWYIDLTVKEGNKLTVATEITLHLRADVHRSRKKAGEKDPKRVGEGTSEVFPFLMRTFAKDSRAVLTATGSCAQNCGCYSYTHSQKGTKEYRLPNAVSSGDTSDLTANYGWVNRDKITLQLILKDFKAYSFTETVRDDCSNVSETHTNLVPYIIFAQKASQQVTGSLPELVFKNPDGFDFTIASNSFKFPSIYSEICTCQSTVSPVGILKWQSSTPRFAPTDQTPARIGTE